MRPTWRVRITGAAGLCLLCVPFAQGPGPGPTPSPISPSAVLLPRRAAPGTPFEQALGEARWFRRQAILAEAREPAFREAGTLAAETEVDPAPGERRLMARDGSGCRRRAQQAVERAAALAQSPGERYRAAALRAYLECEAGHPRAELRQAQTLMALAPRREESLVILRRAAMCNHLPLLARRATAALRVLADEQADRGDRPTSPRRPDSPTEW